MASAAQQAEARSVLDLITTLALQTSPVDIEALEFVKRTVAFFEVLILTRNTHFKGCFPHLDLRFR